MLVNLEPAFEAAVAARDRGALEKALGFRLLSFSALTQALDQGLTAAELAGLGRACRRSADAPLALDRLLTLLPSIRLPAAQWSPFGRAALASVLGGSHVCCRYLTGRPAMAQALARGDYVRHRKPLRIMRDDLRQRRVRATDDEAFEQMLRRYRVREWVRIVARSLCSLANTAAVLGELSDLADAVIDAATRYYLRRERSRGGPWLPRGSKHGVGFAVLAQGKLGAQELNMSSDVDVQFLYSHSDPASPPLPHLHERYHGAAQRIVQSLSRRDDHGFCYRVDLDLRPEGKKGALVNSVAGAEHYYEVWGQSWERLALLRARHVGGAPWVTASFLTAMRPFVFPRSLDMATVEEIRALKERLHEERKSQSVRRGREIGVDIKRDAGCIREIELFVQILQILNGGRVPALRTTSLHIALQRLQFAGLLPIATGESLERAYLYFRRVENALQAVDERQTHRLPDNAEELDHVARMLSPPRRTGRSPRPGARLARNVARERRLVTRMTRSLFAAPRTKQSSNRSRTLLRQAFATDGEVRLQALSGLGFADPKEAAGALAAMAQEVGGPFSPHAPEKVRALAAPLLADVAKSPDPDQALRLFASLNPALRRHPGYLRMLAETPALRRRLLDLLGSSEFLGRTILHFPELIDWLAAARDPGSLMARRADTMLAEVNARLGKLHNLGPADATDDPEFKLRSLRRFKLQEQLRIAMLDLAGTLPLPLAQTQLTLLAEVCLRAAWDLARADLAERLGTAADTGFCIVALGRLGAQEMGYGSDLDLLFVFDDTADPALDARAAVRLAQRLIQNITIHVSEGVLYPIDTRLRPSGAQGPLVSSAAGFTQYHRARAMLWERQALLRARPVAGDLALGERILNGLADVRYPAVLQADAGAEIHRLRTRMLQELSRKQAGPFNVKTGRGGLVDLEFAVQYLQLKHAHAHPALQVTSTPQAITALGEVKLLSPKRVAAMQQAYKFLRQLENRLRIVHDRPITAVELDGPKALSLARRMGYPPRAHAQERLRRDYQRVTDRVARLYDQIFAP